MSAPRDLAVLPPEERRAALVDAQERAGEPHSAWNCWACYPRLCRCTRDGVR